MRVSTDGDDAEIDVGSSEIALSAGPAELGRAVLELNDRVRRQEGVIRDMGIAAAMANVAIAELRKELAAELAARRRAEEERDALRKEVEIDRKTGLNSESSLRKRQTRMDKAIAASQADERRSKPFRATCVYLDYDGFGTINGIVGEPVADILLGKIGTKLRAVIRDEDTAYRIGGDEGMIIMPHISVVSPTDREELRTRIDQAGKEAFEEFVAELEAEGRHEWVAQLRSIVLYGYSVGIACYRASKHGNMKDIELEANADMRRDKRSRHKGAGVEGKSTLPPKQR